LRELRPDLVLTYNWGAIESVAAARSLSLPIVHHEDGFLPDEVERRHARRNWTRRLALRGAAVIVPSTGLAEIARREWGVRDVHHLVNGVDLQRFAPRSVGARGEATLVVGTVGGLRPEKDHATLLRALVEVPSVRLRLVGDGPLRGALEALARELEVFDRVDFVGSTDDTAAQYRAMDVFVISSCTEQMPLVLLEAMAAGLPVVTTDVGDIARILPPSAAPLVVPARQPQRLAAALRTAVADAALRTQLGADNRRRVEERFAAGLCLDRFLAVYDAAMASKRR
jgi:glycosyltransferase involved in cell wall biosynthesis